MPAMPPQDRPAKTGAKTPPSVHLIKAGPLLRAELQVHRRQALVELSTDDAPTSGTTGTSPPSSQASTTWLGVAPISAATDRSTASRAAVPGWSNSAPSGLSART
jgi:hypothetical protein